MAEAGGCCERCTKTFHPSIYDFHHRDTRTKEFNLDRSNFNRKWEKLKIEAAKCHLLCANCHRAVHVFMEKRFLEFELPTSLANVYGKV